MKKVILIPLFCLFLATYSIVQAHPPQDIIITFDARMNLLRAIIVHNTNDPKTHFIKKVDIGLNGQEVIEHKLSRQDNFETQIVTYLIPDAKAGDVISVEAYCSISGVLKQEIKAGE